MYVNTNISSTIARNNLTNVSSSLSKSMERLSSGLRINSASDDAAGLSISTRMQAQVTGMDQAYRNAQDGVSLIQTAEGAMGTISDVLQRARELAVQADNGTNSSTDLTSIQGEIDQLVKEIDHISQTSTFNGISLLDGSKTEVKLHISDKATDTISVSLTKVDSASLLGATLNVSTDAQGAISAIDTALDKLSSARGDLGATQNRLGFISDNLTSAKTNTEASKSRIADTDMSAEMSELTKNQVLQQATISMLAKANQQPQSVLSLLQG
ncbi:flagellin [Bacillus mexicanus]|uniref:flagellin N-terminal helical domain-containing protein n=1 Tax=Bacillus mexicanus TaxID=2834415 RepID=UPI003D198815